jgi:hypothetical protein
MPRDIDITAEDVEIKPGNRDEISVRVSGCSFDDPIEVLKSLDADDIRDFARKHLGMVHEDDW